MKRIILAGLSAGLAVSTLAVAAGTADAATQRTPGCVTRAEYAAIAPGQSPLKVAATFGDAGYLDWREVGSDHGRRITIAVREFHECDSAGHPITLAKPGHWVEVAFIHYDGQPYHADAKASAHWGGAR